MTCICCRVRTAGAKLGRVIPQTAAWDLNIAKFICVECLQEHWVDVNIVVVANSTDEAPTFDKMPLTCGELKLVYSGSHPYPTVRRSRRSLRLALSVLDSRFSSLFPHTRNAHGPVVTNMSALALLLAHMFILTSRVLRGGVFSC